MALVPVIVQTLTQKSRESNRLKVEQAATQEHRTGKLQTFARDPML